jgi:hypothetical protein
MKEKIEKLSPEEVAELRQWLERESADRPYRGPRYDNRHGTDANRNAA